MKYTPYIGLEIHIELKTKTKIFCSCKNDPEEKNPNINICPICTGQPGTLPVINREAVKKTIKTGLALNCKISEISKFDRKNYFYPDLPKGYQISQYDKPFCIDGYLEIKGKKIRIKRIHLEEDTGRLIHPAGKNYSLVDFNRAGVPLMELVTEPDLSSEKEAREFAETLQLILKYLDVSEADMEKGQMRVEVNISLTKDEKLGTKVEIKNLNSFRAVERSINYEIKRQSEILDKNKKVEQETRGWDDQKEITVRQRKKEEANDYRYFPEPDLPTLYLDKGFIEKIKAEIPELPAFRKKRLIDEYKLNDKEAEIFTINKDLGEYFEKVISELAPRLPVEKLRSLIKLTTNYLISDVLGLLKGSYFIEKEFKITPENFAGFISLIYEGKISSKIAKMVLEEMFISGADPLHIIKERGLDQLKDEGEIEKIVKEVILKNPQAVNDYKKGKKSALQFLVGQIMAKTRGRAEPNIVQQLLKKLLQ